MRDVPKVSGSYRASRGQQQATPTRREGARIVDDIDELRPLGPRSFQLTIITRGRHASRDGR